MSLVIGNILKITQHQTNLNQQTENVWFYRTDAVPTPPDGVALYDYVLQRFNSVVGIPMRTLQSTNDVHTSYRIDNVSNGIDFSEITINLGGGVSGNAEPPFVALNFVLRRTTGVTRNGSKRIGGLSEDSVSGNDFSGSLDSLHAFEAAMAAHLVTSDVTPDPFATPVIVGRQLYTTHDGKEAYKLDLTKINPIASAAFTAISTQRSRKLGRGK